ncbi:putative alpha/beta hydrolase [Xylariales sp. AK1849]|nr:putative alpha/beta hydrolase [Xylariales sp. AK1849]
MVTETEGTFQVGDHSLHTKTWLPDGPLNAKMIMIHGFSDHVDRYYDFFPTLARAGIAVYGFDQRGWGRSVKKSSQRGLTGPTSEVIAEIAAFIKSQLPSEVPVFVLGHSMGGGQVLTLASSTEYDDVISQVRGWILEAPFIGFTPEEEPGWLTVFSGRLAGKLMPHFHLVRPILPEKLVRDPAVQQSIRDDELMHDTGTLEGLASMLDRTNALSTGKTKLSPKVKSLILMHGDSDRVCSYDKAKAWYEKETVEDGEFRTFKGFYHQMHADPGKEKFYEEVRDWILERSGGKTAGVAVTGVPTGAKL